MGRVGDLLAKATATDFKLLEDEENVLRLHAFVDRSVIEVFVNHRRYRSRLSVPSNPMVFQAGAAIAYDRPGDIVYTPPIGASDWIASSRVMDTVVTAPGQC